MPPNRHAEPRLAACAFAGSLSPGARIGGYGRPAGWPQVSRAQDLPPTASSVRASGALRPEPGPLSTAAERFLAEISHAALQHPLPAAVLFDFTFTRNRWLFLFYVMSAEIEGESLREAPASRKSTSPVGGRCGSLARKSAFPPLDYSHRKRRQTRRDPS